MADGRQTGHESRGGRVRHAKVKTGCITCRRRRVKCDETRPSCLRCLKYGTVCSGYPAGRRRAPSSQYGSAAAAARALVPKDESQLAAQVLTQPSSMLFETDLDHRYFKLFVDRIAGEICPYFNSDDWSRMLLQACISESSIRHVGGAIGALAKFYEFQHAGQSIVGQQRIDPEQHSDTDSSSSSRGLMRRRNSSNSAIGQQFIRESRMHQRQAYVLYDKALKKMQADLAAGTQSKRTTLIICIIIVCLEALSGRHEVAAGQVYGGLKMIQEWKAEQKEADRHPQGFSSPAPDVVDDFLVQTFGRMEIQAMSVFDPRPVQVHEALKKEGKEVVQSMPAVFSSISQARIYLDLINRRLMHFNRSIQDRGFSVPTVNPKSTDPDSLAQKAVPWIDGKNPDSSPTVKPYIIAEQTDLSNELATWTQTFQPLLNFSLAMGRQEAISALTLTISTIASRISLHAAFFTSELPFDIFLPEFRQIVEQATILLKTQRVQDSATISTSPTSPTQPTASTPKSSGGPMMRFAFDIGVIPPLYLVMIKCRHRRLRRQALSLLKEYPRREGVWDTVAVTHLGRWVIGLEEEGARKISMSLSPRTEGGDVDSPGPDPASRGGNEERRKGGVESGYGSGIGSRNCNERRSDDEDLNIEIPEEIRVRKTWMRFDLSLRTAWMNCLQMDPVSRDYVPRTEIVRW